MVISFVYRSPRLSFSRQARWNAFPPLLFRDGSPLAYLVAFPRENVISKTTRFSTVRTPPITRYREKKIIHLGWLCHLRNQRNDARESVILNSKIILFSEVRDRNESYRGPDISEGWLEPLVYVPVSKVRRMVQNCRKCSSDPSPGNKHWSLAWSLKNSGSRCIIPKSYQLECYIDIMVGSYTTRLIGWCLNRETNNLLLLVSASQPDMNCCGVLSSSSPLNISFLSRN